uniref:FlgD Ig-like domain-containing protein n=1 Tax=candidate division WOR-3 bacterium TaxID=2052148 RepID=A0A7C4GD26_UNCW3
MRRLFLLTALIAGWLVPTASAVDFTGICFTGRYTIAIDSVEFLTQLGWFKLTTPDWGGDSLVTDSFDFTAVLSWPEAGRLHMLVNGGETQFRIDTLEDGVWYTLPLPPPSPQVKFCLPNGIAGPGPAVAATVRLQPDKTVARGPVGFRLSAANPARFEVFDPTGRPVASMPVAAGAVRLNWSATDAQGRLLPAGAYLCRLSDGLGQAVSRVVIAR